MKVISTEKKRSRWQIWLWGVAIPLAVTIACIVLLPIYTGVLLPAVGAIDSEELICGPNGNPTIPSLEQRYNYLSSEAALTISLGFGDFSFATAKTIDICWDLVVGRGGQLLLSWITYRAMRRSLVRTMEKRALHLPLVTQLTLDGVSFFALGAMLKQLFKRTGTAMILCYLYIVIYVMMFSTIMSAMTGYAVTMDLYYQDPASGEVQQASRFEIFPPITLYEPSKLGISFNDSVTYRWDASDSTTKALFYCKLQPRIAWSEY